MIYEYTFPFFLFVVVVFVIFFFTCCMCRVLCKQIFEQSGVQKSNMTGWIVGFNYCVCTRMNDS